MGVELELYIGPVGVELELYWPMFWNMSDVDIQAKIHQAAKTLKASEPQTANRRAMFRNF